MLKTATRKHEIDVVRGIAIILVILGHLGVPYLLNTLLFGFVLPLYFMLSGYLYRPGKWQNTTVAAFTIQKARAYLLPYLVLSIVNFIYNLLLESRQMPLSELADSSKSHLIWLLLSNDVYGSSPNCEAIWFLPCFFLTSIGFYLVHPRFKPVIFFPLLALLQWILVLTNIHLPWHINLLPCNLIFMEAGYMIANRGLLKKPFFYPCAALIIGIAGCLCNPQKLDLNHMSFGNPAAALCGAFGMSYAVLYFCTHVFRKCAVLELYGRNALFIMGTHMIFASILLMMENRIPFLQSMGYQWWLNAILLLICFVPACLILEKIHGCRSRS
jgi:fucose 4-O-acetylase-like acetyltransferase